jgi:hypothetical protein
MDTTDMTPEQLAAHKERQRKTEELVADLFATDDAEKGGNYCKLREVWSIRIRLQMRERLRDLAMFNLAIDSKLRGCDLVAFSIAADIRAFLSQISICSEIARASSTSIPR